MATGEIKVFCPKCKAMPGEPCVSIRTGAEFYSWPYHFHKKRRIMLYLGDPSTESRMRAVPVRPANVRRLGL